MKGSQSKGTEPRLGQFCAQGSYQTGGRKRLDHPRLALPEERSRTHCASVNRSSTLRTMSRSRLPPKPTRFARRSKRRLVRWLPSMPRKYRLRRTVERPLSAATSATGTNAILSGRLLGRPPALPRCRTILQSFGEPANDW
jgi:hypothetical protein